MKAIKRSELVIGNQYFTNDSEKSSLLILEKKTDQRLYFKPINNTELYAINDNGFITFNNNDFRSDFYEHDGLTINP
jgi:hypothetical protein